MCDIPDAPIHAPSVLESGRRTEGRHYNSKGKAIESVKELQQRST
jgi:hypothetical protein